MCKTDDVDRCPFCSQFLPPMATDFCPTCGSSIGKSPASTFHAPAEAQPFPLTSPALAWNTSTGATTSAKRKKMAIIGGAVVAIIAALTLAQVIKGNPATSNHQTLVNSVPTNFCQSGPECYTPFQQTAFNNYDNTVTKVADCTFAAAGDFIILREHVTPGVSTILADFIKAGGSNSGLSISNLDIYWKNDGIDGFHLSAASNVNLDQNSIESALRSNQLLYVELNFTNNQMIGQFPVGSGGHAAVLDGFTPSGPLLVTWGTTVPITWAQWSTIAVQAQNLTLQKV